MSKVTVQGNASGTGTLTIAAPNTNSNYTLTLPTQTGTFGLTSDPGRILQTVSAYLDNTVATSTSTYTSYLSLSITPSSASNKILVLVSGGACVTNAAGRYGYGTIYRNSTNLAAGANNDALNYIAGVNSEVFTPWSMSIIDSPNTTSATTYAFYFKTNSTAVYPNTGARMYIHALEILV